MTRLVTKIELEPGRIERGRMTPTGVWIRAIDEHAAMCVKKDPPAFVERHPAWTIIFLCLVCWLAAYGALETAATILWGWR